MRYWMMKCEPSAYSIDDLEHAPNQTYAWDGVRNYQARNMLRDDFKVGDFAFFYHSNVKVPGVVGVMQVIRAGYPDDTAWNPESRYYDPKSSLDKPRWYQVDVQFVKKLPRLISLNELRTHPELEDLLILRTGNRLSITPMTERQWNAILSMIS